MIKVNLIEKKKTFVAPIVLGVDLSSFPIKQFILVLVITQLPLKYFASYLEDLNKQSGDTIRTLRIEEGKLRKEIRKNKKTSKKLEQFNNKIDDLKKRGKQVESILKARTNPRHLLEKIARLTPSRLWLDKLIIEKSRRIVFEGGAEDYRSIGEFIKNLNETPYFDGELQIKKSKTVSERIKKQSYRIETFSIEGRIKSFNPFLEGTGS